MARERGEAGRRRADRDVGVGMSRTAMSRAVRERMHTMPTRMLKQTPILATADTLCARTQGRLRRLFAETDALLDEARAARLGAAERRLKAFNREAAARGRELRRLSDQVDRLLTGGTRARLTTERVRLETAVRDMRRRRAAVSATSAATARLLAANGWARASGR